MSDISETFNVSQIEKYMILDGVLVKCNNCESIIWEALEYLDLWQSHNTDTDVLISIQDLRNILERQP